MKLLQPLFSELQEKTASLTDTFSADEIRTIEPYFVKATTIMKETTEKLNDS